MKKLQKNATTKSQHNYSPTQLSPNCVLLNGIVQYGIVGFHIPLDTL